MKKLLSIILIIFSFYTSFGQTYNNVGNTLQRAATSQGYVYRFNLGSPGFMYLYTQQQQDSLLAKKVFYSDSTVKFITPTQLASKGYFTLSSPNQRVTQSPIFANGVAIGRGLLVSSGSANFAGTANFGFTGNEITINNGFIQNGADDYINLISGSNGLLSHGSFTFQTQNAGTTTNDVISFSGSQITRASDGASVVWSTSSSVGTVTNVSSTTADIVVNNQSTIPSLTLASVNGISLSYFDPTSSIQNQLNSKLSASSAALTYQPIGNQLLNTSNQVQFSTVTVPNFIQVGPVNGALAVGLNGSGLTFNDAATSIAATYQRNYFQIQDATSGDKVQVTANPAMTGAVNVYLPATGGTLANAATTLAGYGITDGITAATAAATFQPLSNQLVNTTNAVTFNGVTSTAPLTLTAQSSTPSAPASNTQLIYANAAGAFTIMGSNGYSASISKGAFSSAHTFYLPDVTDTLLTATRFRGLSTDLYNLQTQLNNYVAATLTTNLNAWTNSFAFTSLTLTRAASQAVISGTIQWPDGSTGTFTTDVASTAFPGAVDAFHVTYVPASGTSHTITQPTVTRNSSGSVINQPALTII